MHFDFVLILPRIPSFPICKIKTILYELNTKFARECSKIPDHTVFTFDLNIYTYILKDNQYDNQSKRNTSMNAESILAS